jgi:uncharacterized protein YaiI (UPF0178 family)
VVTKPLRSRRRVGIIIYIVVTKIKIMSEAKKFLILQDLILAKTSIEKVLLHINSREKPIFSWIKRELNETIRKLSKDEKFAPKVKLVNEAIQSQDLEKLRKSLEELRSLLEKEITEIYKSLK